MALIEPNDSLKLDYAVIDDDHERFIALLNRLDTADNAAFPQLFEQLYQHTVEHFEQENYLMEQYGFPAQTEHKGEHQRVLGEFKQFKQRVDKGLIAFGRSYVKDRLPQWFKLHLSTMDGALVAYIKLQLSS